MAVIFHVDVNSAFLSWTAAYRVLVLGETEDLREIPAAVCGDQEERHGIVLAKSLPAKRLGVRTGEPLFQARRKCPSLRVVPPDYELYVQASRRLIALLREVSPAVEQFSVDEAWADMSGTAGLHGSPVAAACALKDRIRNQLGFTVNIGVSSNKLLAKMAGDFEKPDKVHTLFSEEIPAKLWPLPVRGLFSVGPATEGKLRRYGIATIGDLAHTDPAFLRGKLGKNGERLWHMANGRCVDPVRPVPARNKGYGHSVTTAGDVTDRAAARRVLLSLCETVGMRMRRDGQRGMCVAVQLRTAQFVDFSHQLQLDSATNVTAELYRAACAALDEAWPERPPLRQLGVQVSRLRTDGVYRQYSIFDGARYDRLEKVDAAVDALREKFGEEAVFRARFLDHPASHMSGGLSRHRRTGVTKEVPER
ncbi:MAG: DNA polymerase IV [Oscillospiraceae bacterium]|nr:DNA polymerase IV [Oscillospiraceae bacterium]